MNKVRKPRYLTLVICEIATDALRYLGHITSPTEEALMAAFEKHKSEIRLLASSKYDEGMHRPQVTLNDLIKRSANKLGLEIRS